MYLPSGRASPVLGSKGRSGSGGRSTSASPSASSASASSASSTSIAPPHASAHSPPHRWAKVIAPPILARCAVSASASLNEGVYVRSDADGGLQRELDHVGKALRDTNLAALRASGALVLWRETLAQHFPTPSGLYAKPGLGIDPARSLIQGSCRPLRDASVAARANSAVTSLVRSFNVSVLRAFSTSANRWDEHIDRHSEYARTKNSTDCTHFCEPSSLMATLNGELLAAVRRSDRSKS